MKNNYEQLNKLHYRVIAGVRRSHYKRKGCRGNPPEKRTGDAVKSMTVRKTEGLFHLLWSRNRGSLEYDGQQNKMFCKYCKATSSVCDRVFQLQRRDIHSGNL